MLAKFIAPLSTSFSRSTAWFQTGYVFYGLLIMASYLAFPHTDGSGMIPAHGALIILPNQITFVPGSRFYGFNNNYSFHEGKFASSSSAISIEICSIG